MPYRGAADGTLNVIVRCQQAIFQRSQYNELAEVTDVTHSFGQIGYRYFTLTVSLKLKITYKIYSDAASSELIGEKSQEVILKLKQVITEEYLLARIYLYSQFGIEAGVS